ncbi:phage tail protein [Enterococcus sp. JM4C]|uniref:major tail protein n=1 Tax=Candidatus Enterococcus huntleyi TaxID=1857217 RepID=UPI00137A933A|nr:major tail protein [Enterococcus sp. JM4C]KAF1295186.1 phage tail protein [Enterococcus sp. JM4C]
MDAQEIKFFEGLSDILIAPMLTQETTTTEPTYDAVIQLPIATKLAIKGNGSTLEKYASSKLFRSISRETKHEIGLDHVGIPVDLLDKLKDLKASKGVTFSNTKAKQYPFFAFGFIGNIEGGAQMAVWYPKVQLSNVIDEEYVTTEAEIDIKDVTANLVAYGLNIEPNNMFATFNSLRDTAAGVTLDKFIKQPVISESQWNELAAATGGGGGK